jgi:hypothetical protein
MSVELATGVSLKNQSSFARFRRISFAVSQAAKNQKFIFAGMVLPQAQSPAAAIFFERASILVKCR